MRLSFGGLALLLSCALGTALFAQQDQTVQWKTSLQDLTRWLPDLPAAGPSAVAAWRSDAGDLRSGLVSLAASRPDLKLNLPEALPAQPSREQMTQQLAALSAAVDDVIRQSPGTPFNLGRMDVNVSAAVTAPSPVTASIDQSQISNLDLVNAAKALDYLPGVSIQHLNGNRNEAGNGAGLQHARASASLYRRDSDLGSL